MPIPFARILAKIFFERFFHAFVSCGRWTFVFFGGARFSAPPAFTTLPPRYARHRLARWKPRCSSSHTSASHLRGSPETARSMCRFQARKWSKPHRGFAKKAFARPLHREGYNRVTPSVIPQQQAADGMTAPPKRRAKIEKQLRAEARSCHQNRRSKVRGTQELCWGVSGGV